MKTATHAVTCAAIVAFGITASGVTVSDVNAANTSWRSKGAPSQVHVFTERCEHEHQRGNDVAIYAEHQFENEATAVDIARAKVLGRRTKDDLNFEMPTYTYRVVSEGIVISDGAIAVRCGSKRSGYAFDEVKIVVPRSYKLDLDVRDPW